MDLNSITKLIDTLGNRINDIDDNSYDNTLIQFFEEPYDPVTLTATLAAYVNGASISQSPTDQASITASAVASTADPSTFTWGGYDANGTYWNAGWNYGYGGVWK